MTRLPSSPWLLFQQTPDVSSHQCAQWLVSGRTTGRCFQPSSWCGPTSSMKSIDISQRRYILTADMLVVLVVFFLCVCLSFPLVLRTEDIYSGRSCGNHWVWKVPHSAVPDYGQHRGRCLQPSVVA